jgi:hypothetical protein
MINFSDVTIDGVDYVVASIGKSRAVFGTPVAGNSSSDAARRNAARALFEHLMGCNQQSYDQFAGGRDQRVRGWRRRRDSAKG